MRRALFALLILAVAGQAKVPPKARPAAAAPAPADLSNVILPPPIPLAASRPGGDAGQCRAACAKQLYFCNAGSEDDGCGGRWAQCNASCTASYASPRFLGTR